MATPSAAEQVKDYIKTQFHDGADLLQRLPPHTDLEWIKYYAGTPQTAVSIGTNMDDNVVAFLTDAYGKPNQVRYAMIFPCPDDFPGGRELKFDGLDGCNLFAPFKYIKGSHIEDKKRFGNVIKWYFMAKGLLENDIVANDTALKDFCKSLYRALVVNDLGLATARPIASGSKPPTPCQPSPPPETRQNLGLIRRSRHSQSRERSVADDKTSSRRSLLPSTQPVAATTCEGSVKPTPADVVAVKLHLQSKGMAHLLENIPGLDEMEFSTQRFDDEGGYHCLYLGNGGDECMFAYMKENKGAPSIRYFVRKNKDDFMVGKPINAPSILLRKPTHPFNKCCPPNFSGNDYFSSRRLRTMVTWYFMLHGNTKNSVVGSSMDFISMMKKTLLAVEEYMGAAAVGYQTSSTAAKSERDLQLERDELLERNQEMNTENDGPTSDHGLSLTRSNDNSSPLSSPLSSSSSPEIVPRMLTILKFPRTAHLIQQRVRTEHSPFANPGRTDSPISTRTEAQSMSLIAPNKAIHSTPTNDIAPTLGIKRSAETIESDEDTKFESLALMFSDERAKTEQIERWSKSLSVIDAKRESGIAALDKTLVEERERMHKEYTDMCQKLENGIAAQKQALEEEIEGERKELISLKQSGEAERESMRKKIKLTGWGASG